MCLFGAISEELGFVSFELSERLEKCIVKKSKRIGDDDEVGSWERVEHREGAFGFDRENLVHRMGVVLGERI